MEREIYGARFEPLEGYNVKYSRSAAGLPLKIISQLNKILTKINLERRWVEDYTSITRVDAILSDNRYGFAHPLIPSILVTHQLAPKTGLGHFADRLLQRNLYRYISKFNKCWVPDYPTYPDLAGSLSHPGSLPNTHVEYIGALSRLFTMADGVEDIDLLIIISGPEPQRSIFEKKILGQLHLLATKKIVLVRGLPGDTKNKIEQAGNLEIYQHANAEKLNALVRNAKLIVCRPGYTTLMDMMKLRKKMVVVPTPGQAEQEYLADYFMNNNYAKKTSQKTLSVLNCINEGSSFNYRFPDFDMQTYCKAVRSLHNELLFDHAGN